MSVETLGRGLRRIVAPNPGPLTGAGTNTWIVGAGDGVAVIDPGPDDARHLSAILAALAGARVAAIVVSHAHADHSGLARRLAEATGARIAAHGPPDPAGWRADARGEGIDRTFRPDIVLRDGAVVEGPDWRLRVLHTPGHLPDHLCLAWGRRLFSGDHAMGWATSLVAPPEGDMAAYRAGLRRLQGETWSELLPGHGPPVADAGTRLAELIAHRDRREAEICASLASGARTIAEIRARVYVGLAPALAPAAELNIHAHLVELQSEKRVLKDAAADRPSRFRLP